MAAKLLTIVGDKTEPPEKFVRGDAVRLKSGGHPMTVRAFENKKYTVDWHADTGEPMAADYFPEMLRRAPEELQEDEEVTE